MQTTKQQVNSMPAFLEGGGEMGALTRAFDWSSTSIGNFDKWPQSLCTVVGMLLSAKFPMFLWWESDLIQFYNDAYRPSLGNNGKHPLALGQKGEECWPEIWNTIQPVIGQVFSGGDSVWFEDALIPIYRNGCIKNVYWTFSYGPVKNETGEIKGVLVVCSETTEKVTGIKKIEDARNQLAFATDAAELATWDLNPATGRVTGNGRLKDWFGLEPDEEIEMELALNSIAEKDRQRVNAAIKASMQFSSGGKYEIEYLIINSKTSQERIVRARGKATFNGKQEPCRFTGTLQDITGEISAREQRQKLLTLVDSSVDLMSILELDGKNSYINKAGRDILGIAQDADVSSIPISDFHTPEQILFVESEIIPNVMSKGKWAGAFAVRNIKSREIIPLFNNCHRIDDIDTGEPIGVGAVMRDMRPELNARKELAESLERFRLLADSMPQFVWTGDPSGNLNYYNQAVYVYSGLSVEEIEKNGWLQIVHPEDSEENIKLWTESVTTGKDFLFEHRFRRHDGEYRWQLSRALPQRDEEGIIRMWVGTSTDIHDQKIMSKKLEQKVTDRTRELEEANEQLEKKNKELDSFAYVSSHDLQEPLRKINTFISRIEEGGMKTLSEKDRDYFERIKMSATRMQVLINDLLSFSRTSTSEKEFVSTDLDLLLREVTTDLNETIQKTGTIIEIEELPTLTVIYFQFYQLFVNLITNAIKFAKKEEAPQIHISGEYVNGSDLHSLPADAQTRYYHIIVEDQGIGFEPEYRERIFEVFQRLHGRSEYEGTGIGLAICKKIVENHHGFITAEGEPGEGARFHIYIPG